MGEKVLPYDKSVVPQERFYDCGPASVQVILNSLGINVSEDVLIREIGTTENGTDYVGMIERYLDRRLPNAKYTSVYWESDPASDSQKESLWANLKKSIDAGYGVVMNWVSPPGNRPRAIKGSGQPNYGRNTVWHYVPAVGYSDVGERAVFVADSGFRPFGYWVPFDGPGSACSLIPPKGYCYANVVGAVDAPSASKPTIPSRDRHALAIIAKGREMGVTPRGIQIALSTALVESNLVMYANSKDVESLKLPHEAVGNDGMSVGLFQQQNFDEWGSLASRMSASGSAEYFFKHLITLDYNSTGDTPGFFAQRVQRSAYPTRYDERFADAVEIYNRLSTMQEREESMANVPQEQWDRIYRDLTQRLPSRSPLRHVGEGPVDTEAGMVLNADANLHVLLVKSLAEMGDLNALTLLAEVAGIDVDVHPDRAADANLAKRILAYIEVTNPSVLNNYLKGTK